MRLFKLSCCFLKNLADWNVLARVCCQAEVLVVADRSKFLFWKCQSCFLLFWTSFYSVRTFFLLDFRLADHWGKKLDFSIIIFGKKPSLVRVRVDPRISSAIYLIPFCSVLPFGFTDSVLQLLTPYSKISALKRSHFLPNLMFPSGSVEHDFLARKNCLQKWIPCFIWASWLEWCIIVKEICII